MRSEWILTGLLTAVLWALICRQWAQNNGSGVKLLKALFIVGLVLRVSFAFLTPRFYAPDEIAHFRYVQYLAEHKSLPVAPKEDMGEYYQPPLYYIVSTPAYLAADSLGADQLGKVRAIRCLSILTWAWGTLLFLKFLKQIDILETPAGVFAAAMVTLLPTYTYTSAMINNDNLVNLAGLALWPILHATKNWKNAAGLGIFLGVSMLAKFTGSVLIAAALAYFAVNALQKKMKARDALLFGFIVVGIAAVMLAPWLVRNLHVYNSLTVEELGNKRYFWPSFTVGRRVITYVFTSTFWACAGRTNNVLYIPHVGQLLWLLSGIGLVWTALCRKTFDNLTSAAKSVLAAGGIATAINLVLIVRFAVLYAQGQGRFSYVILGPIGLIMGLGLGAFFKDRYQRIATYVLSGILLCYTTSFHVYVIMTLNEFTKSVK